MSSSTLIIAGLREELINLGNITLIIEAEASIFLRPVKNTSSFDKASSTDIDLLSFPLEKTTLSGS